MQIIILILFSFVNFVYGGFHYFHRRYFNQDAGNEITWSLNKPSVFLDFDYTFHVLIDAFSEWEGVANLKFKNVDPGEVIQNKRAHIIITFEQENLHQLIGTGVSCEFGTNDIIAHAYFPPIHEIHFRDSPNYYQVARTQYGPSLFVTAVHEIGHILGFRHSPNHESIMYPTADLYRRWHKRINLLHYEDVKKVKNTYGSKHRVFGFKWDK